MAGSSHALGHAPPEPQELEAPPEHRDARELPAGVRAADRAAGRPVRVSSADRVQQADPEDTEESAAESAEETEAPKRRVRAKKSAKATKATKATKAEKEPKPKEKKTERPALTAGQVHVYSLDGDVLKSVELPPVFRSEVRTDLIRRAVTSAQANRRQPYGSSFTAGTRHSVRWSGKGHGVSRVPRIRGTMIGAQAPGTVGGRRAHPPRIQAIWAKKINDHERRLARNAALAAVRDPSLVSLRGHRFDEDLSLPVIVEDGIEAVD